MNQEHKIIFYRSLDGRDSSLDEIENFGDKDSLKIYRAINLLKLYGLHLSADRIKHIADKIWELKIDRYRILYFLYEDRQFILVRAFMKKTDKTPAREIRIAKKRYLDYVSRSEGE